MAAPLTTPLSSVALPAKDAALRAVFSPILAEVRKSGHILTEEEGSFYAGGFDWRESVRAFFDAYHRICERKQIEPRYQESALKSAIKVPYASLETIRLLHSGAAARLLQLRDLRIPPFRDIPAENPSWEDLERLARSTDDPDVKALLNAALTIDRELRKYLAQLERLAEAYEKRASAPRDLKRCITDVLSPYIKKLKHRGILPPSWSYPYEALSAPAPKAAPAPRTLTRPAPKPKPKTTGLSKPSLWRRFDKWVTGIGDWMGLYAEEIVEWVMKITLYGLIGLCVIGLVGVWISDGFWSMVIGGVVLAVVGGIFVSLLEILAVVYSYLLYIPLYIVRYIFYRGWTLLLVLLLAAGYLLYRYYFYA